MRKSALKVRGVLVLDETDLSSASTKMTRRVKSRGGIEMTTSRRKRSGLSLKRSAQYPIPRGLLIGL